MTLINTHLFLEFWVGVDPVHLPSLGKECSKGQGETNSQEPQAKLYTRVKNSDTIQSHDIVRFNVIEATDW